MNNNDTTGEIRNGYRGMQGLETDINRIKTSTNKMQKTHANQLLEAGQKLFIQYAI